MLLIQRICPVALVTAAFLYSMCVPTHLAAQSLPLAFRADAHLVQLGVFVTASGGASLDGLTAADFLVRDNGKVRPVSTVIQPTWANQ